MRVDPLWSREEIEAIREALEHRSEDIRRGYATEQTAARDRLFFALSVNSGLRASDLVTLPADRRKWSGQRYTVKTKKTGKVVQFSVVARVRAALDDYWAAHPEHPSFLFYPTDRGRPRYQAHVTTKWALRFFCEWAARAGLEGHYGSHTGRKTLALHIYEATGRVEVAQDALGHSSPGTTLAYIGSIHRRALEAQANLNL